MRKETGKDSINGLRGEGQGEEDIQSPAAHLVVQACLSQKRGMGRFHTRGKPTGPATKTQESFTDMATQSLSLRRGLLV